MDKGCLLSATERETGAQLRRHRCETLLLLNKEFSPVKPERYRLLYVTL
jgi:hypothetical protein